MQITLQLKGFFKIAVFFLAVIAAAAALTAGGYKAWKYWQYLAYKGKNDHLAQRRQEFRFLFTTKDSLNKNYLLLSPYTTYHNKTTGALVIIDFNGRVIMNKKMPHRVTAFRQWKIDGQICYTYTIDDTDYANHASKIEPQAHVVVLDAALREIKQIHLPAKGLTGADKGMYIDTHDFLLLGDNHYLLLCNVTKTVDNIPSFLSPNPAAKVVAQTILEVQDDSVIWRWDASHNPEFYTNSFYDNDFRNAAVASDYIHINSIAIDPRDSNLILSMRNLHQVLKVNRRSGDIMWRLGGRNSDFALSAPQVFLRQHDASLVDGNTLLLFDNGEQHIRPRSRILEFKLDEANKTVTSFKDYNLTERFSQARGSVAKVGDEYFICGGYAPYLLLVNSKTGEKKMKFRYNQSLYRAYMVADITGVQPMQR